MASSSGGGGAVLPGATRSPSAASIGAKITSIPAAFVRALSGSSLTSNYEKLHVSDTESVVSSSSVEDGKFGTVKISEVEEVELTRYPDGDDAGRADGRKVEPYSDTEPIMLRSDTWVRGSVTESVTHPQSDSKGVAGDDRDSVVVGVDDVAVSRLNTMKLAALPAARPVGEVDGDGDGDGDGGTGVDSAVREDTTPGGAHTSGNASAKRAPGYANLPSGEHSVDDIIGASWGKYGKYQRWLAHTWQFLVWVVQDTSNISLVFFQEFAQDKWDLGDNAKSLTGSAYFLGWALGGLCLNKIADNYGRRIGTYSMLAVVMAASALRGFVDSYEVFVALHFIIGGFGGAYSSTAYVWYMEFCRPSFRPSAGSILFLQAVCGQLYGVLCAVLARNLGELALLTVIPMVLCLMTAPFVPKSPRFLALIGESDKATQVLKKIAAFNGKPLRDGVRVARLNHDPAETSRGSFKDLFSPSLRRATLITMLAFVGANGVVYGVNFLSASLGGTPTFNSTVFALAEAPGDIAMYFFANRMSRRHLIMGGYGVAAVSLILTSVMPQGVALFAFICLGKAMGAAMLIAVFLLGAEVFPTTVRSVGLGACNFVSRLSGVGVVMLTGALPAAAVIIILGLLSTIIAIGAYWLPETKNTNLADHIRQVRKAVSAARLVSKATASLTAASMRRVADGTTPGGAGVGMFTPGGGDAPAAPAPVFPLDHDVAVHPMEAVVLPYDSAPASPERTPKVTPDSLKLRIAKNKVVPLDPLPTERSTHSTSST